jgi:hypothetical protein
MVIVTDPSDLPRITNPAIRELVALRLQQLHLPNDHDSAHVELIVVEAGDVVSEIEQAAGFPLLTGLIDELPFDHPDFYPCTEILEEHNHEHHRIYELVFIGNDDGAATAIFVEDKEGIDADLLAMCRSFATPAVGTP